MRNTICCLALLLVAASCEENQSTQLQLTPMKTVVLGEPFVNSIGMKLAYIPAGEFMMGSRDSAEVVVAKTVAVKGMSKVEPKDFLDEFPSHQVKISRAFYMGTTEVTNQQFEEIMQDDSHRWGLREGGHPVDNVNWEEATEFCRKLSKKEGKTYRLPTEAEWEYACRAGTRTPFHTGEVISTKEAAYHGKCVYGEGKKGTVRKQLSKVGSFPPNDFGLHDMHGNIAEWCQDWYGGDYYANSPTVDPQGPSTGRARVYRGGDWYTHPAFCRSSSRYSQKPRGSLLRPFTVVGGSLSGLYEGIGFRIVLETNEPQ